MAVTEKTLSNLVKPDSPLKDGEGTQATRVRASSEVLAWWASLTTEERGKHITRLYESSGERKN
jgi:hypothetical protein